MVGILKMTTSNRCMIIGERTINSPAMTRGLFRNCTFRAVIWFIPM